MKRLTTRELTLCSLFAALIAIGAFLQIPLPNFDYFTLQFFFVLMAGMLLGARLGAMSAALYVLTGLLGITGICGRWRNFLCASPQLWLSAWLYCHSVLQWLDHGTRTKKLENLLSGSSGGVTCDIWYRPGV